MGTVLSFEKAFAKHVQDKKTVALHYRTQAGQSYGSISRKCEFCGVMIWPEKTGMNTPEWTDNIEVWKTTRTRCTVFKPKTL
jgi:hypothetical protein